jgi:hypothetical protein
VPQLRSSDGNLVSCQLQGESGIDPVVRPGLDQDGRPPGIAGSTAPEADGVFLCEEFQVGFFVRMNNTGGPVDVWEVSGAFEDQMIDNGSGFFYFPGRIPATQVSLFEWP